MFGKCKETVGLFVRQKQMEWSKDRNAQPGAKDNSVVRGASISNTSMANAWIKNAVSYKNSQNHDY
jgi:hypothetical protein